MNGRRVRFTWVSAAVVALGCAGGCAPRTPPALRPDLADRYPVHVVQAGENLYRIALRYDVEMAELQALNELTDPSQLRVGQRLLIPKPLPPPPAPGATETAPRPTPPRDPGALASCSGGRADLAISSAGLSWPVDGVVLARFGEVDGQPHPGIDIGAPLGTPVYASRPGEVTFAGEQPGFGPVVILRHGPGAFTLYARNATLCVEAGDMVQRGEMVGRVGDAGTDVPYLYFEVREDGRPVDPQPRLPR
jgi:murein DD-endopeptidase MepM/ murein hydrolase activator NlpD